MNNYEYDDLNEKMLSSDSMYKGPVFEFRKSKVMLPDGKIVDRDIIVHNGACAVLPVDGNDIIFVVQYRAAVGRLMLEIPAGKLDKNDEEIISCAHRELSEETGYITGNMTFMLSYIPAAGYSSEVIHIYLAENLRESEAHPDEDEFVRTVRIPVDKAYEMCLKGEIQDSKTIIAILYYHEKYVRNI